MPYTTHGYWFGGGEPTKPIPPKARCGGPGMCRECAQDVGIGWPPRPVAAEIEYPHATFAKKRIGEESGVAFNAIDNLIDIGNRTATQLADMEKENRALRAQLEEANQPHRDDAVATWLKHRRDLERHPTRSAEYRALDAALDDYRLHADTGTPLSGEAHDGGRVQR